MFFINFLVEGFLQTGDNYLLDQNTIEEADDNNIEQH